MTVWFLELSCECLQTDFPAESKLRSSTEYFSSCWYLGKSGGAFLHLDFHESETINSEKSWWNSFVFCLIWMLIDTQIVLLAFPYYFYVLHISFWSFLSLLINGFSFPDFNICLVLNPSHTDSISCSEDWYLKCELKIWKCEILIEVIDAWSWRELLYIWLLREVSDRDKLLVEDLNF